MSTPATSGPPNSPSADARQPRASRPAAEMRVGDAERAEVADRLAWHFSHGRLDQAELDDRLDRAMRAKTAADLNGLLADLPGGEPAHVAPGPPLNDQRRLSQIEQERRRLRLERRYLRRAGRASRLRAVGLFVCFIIGAAAIAHWLTRSVLLWLALGLIAYLALGHHASRSGPSTDGSTHPDRPSP
jgi:Domain of unknown function (DUF1707)